MKTFYKVLSILTTLVGVLAILAGIAFTIIGFPAYTEMMKGTTAIVMAGGDATVATSFTMASLGTILLIPGVLVLIAGILGLRATKRGSYRSVVLVSGVIVFALFFDVLLGTESQLESFGCMVFFAVYATIARYLEAKETSC